MNRLDLNEIINIKRSLFSTCVFFSSCADIPDPLGCRKEQLQFLLHSMFSFVTFKVVELISCKFWRRKTKGDLTSLYLTHCQRRNTPSQSRDRCFWSRIRSIWPHRGSRIVAWYLSLLLCPADLCPPAPEMLSFKTRFLINIAMHWRKKVTCLMASICLESLWRALNTEP